MALQCYLEGAKHANKFYLNNPHKCATFENHTLYCIKIWQHICMVLKIKPVSSTCHLGMPQFWISMFLFCCTSKSSQCSTRGGYVLIYVTPFPLSPNFSFRTLRVFLICYTSPFFPNRLPYGYRFSFLNGISSTSLKWQGFQTDIMVFSCIFFSHLQYCLFPQKQITVFGIFFPWCI
jgi:hypothetical protein